MRRLPLFVAALWLFVACSEAPGPAVDPFVDRAAEAGIEFVNFNGMFGEYRYTEIIGSGGALFDYDNDGDLDAYLVQGALLEESPPPSETTYPPRGPLLDRLYRNQLVETGSLRFTDVTAEAGIVSEGYGMGVAVADIDRDGHLDLYVTNYGSNLMLRNRGDGTFTDVTASAGLDDPRWSTSATFLDYDVDGWPDLFVVNYVDYTTANHKDCFSSTSAIEYCGPMSYDPVGQSLFRNRGDGTFEDVSLSSGIARVRAAGLGVVATDFNGDGRTDVYVTSDGRPNVLWVNRGDGTFADEAMLAGCAVNQDGEAEASMGVDAADFDGDGDEDLFMTHLVDETNTLYVNDGKGWFDDATIRTGLGAVSRMSTGFGTAWIDYDNDGALDLVVANGAVKTIESVRRTGHPYPLGQRNQLFKNRGSGAFEDISDAAGEAFATVDVSRGIAAGDVDNDGDTDLLVVNNSGPARLLINQVGTRNDWFGLRLLDERGERDLTGARVEVELSDGSTAWRRARVAGSYCSSGDPRVLVGLGSGRRPTAVRVHWPDGSVERWDDPPVGEYTALRKGEGS